MRSLWEDKVTINRFPSLTRDVNTDVLIIGGGITGILTAFLLDKAGIDYLLVEANTVCCGITKNTTAKITTQHGLIYDKIIKKYGIGYAKLYYKANALAIEKFRNLAQNIDCEFETKNFCVYTLDKLRKIQNEMLVLQMIGCSAKFTDHIDIPIDIAGAIELQNQAQFHPMKFISEISKNLNIFEQTKVEELVGLTAVTNNGKINAKKIIVATHFPFLNKHGLYPLKLYQHRSYVIALENAKQINGMYVDECESGLSFRAYKDLLLLGGSGHRTGKKSGGWNELEKIAHKYYPSSTVKYRWATQDCMSLDGIPYIGPYSKNTEGLFVASGFNKWGMTSSMVAAQILCDLMQNNVNDYTSVFSPSRSILHPQLVSNSVESVVNLITPTTKRCPHLGCALKWNKQERTWDCPCHGSRFTVDGKLIDNPATGDLP